MNAAFDQLLTTPEPLNCAYCTTLMKDQTMKPGTLREIIYVAAAICTIAVAVYTFRNPIAQFSCRFWSTSPTPPLRYMYTCSLYGEAPPQGIGFLGLRKTHPYWNYEIWVGNLSDHDERNVCISATTPLTSDFAYLTSDGKDFTTTLGGSTRPIIASSGHITSGFITDLLARHAVLLKFIISASGMPDPNTLHIHVWFANHDYKKVSATTWQAAGWTPASTP